MDKEKMLDMMGDIAPEFVEEAKPGRMRRVIRTVGSVAAALVICAGLAIAVPKLIKSGPSGVTAQGPLPTESGKTNSAPTGEAYGGTGTALPTDIANSALPGLHLDVTEAPGAVGAGEQGLIGYSSPGNVDFSYSLMTLAEAASRYNYVVTAVCEGGSDEYGIYPFRVTASFGKPLSGETEIMIPSYKNTSLYDGFRPREGNEYLMFLTRRADVMTGRDYFFAEQTVGRDRGRNCISDISDMTYDELVAAIPGMIAENPCEEPDEIIGDFIRSDDPEVIFEGSDAVLLAMVVSVTPPAGYSTGTAEWIMIEPERIIKGDEAKIRSAIQTATDLSTIVPCAIVPAGSVKEGETYVFCFDLIEGTGPLVVSAPNAIFSPDSSEGRLLLNK